MLRVEVILRIRCQYFLVYAFLSDTMYRVYSLDTLNLMMS